MVVVTAAGPAHARGQEPLLEDFSPVFLGMYRKVMEIEPDIRRFARQYDVDVDLARAVCMYESGGNPGLASHAGALGYFQVMPPTYRELQVATNIEAGIKYLSQMIRQFGREDRAVAAYNAGPTRIGRGGSLPLETVQYVMGVGHYRAVIKQFDDALRRHASRLQLASAGPGDTWGSMAARTGIAEWELRLHNPFLSGRELRPGMRLAFPPEPRRDLWVPLSGGAGYRMRHGDHYIKLAITLGIDVESLRAENDLWQTQLVAAGTLLKIPFAIDRARVVTAALGDPASDAPAPRMGRAAGGTATVARAATPPAPPARVHRVRRGDTLSQIARRYATTVAALRAANKLSDTTLRIGQLLLITAGAGGSLE